ncbi:hypothetical protein Q31b_41040 [Novipirellula aureliae]|uniref:Uncharacterized protein n=1 Tax=Novipirellula aureliae TaxID=2527966 RepID=A0A5C6DNZ9_9BACT|nr:hypothetical protein Q31b_41040 [Novipirellula aureliae]
MQRLNAYCVSLAPAALGLLGPPLEYRVSIRIYSSLGLIRKKLECHHEQATG